MKKWVCLSLLSCLVLSVSSVSWAWRGGGGFRGPRFGVYWGGGPGAYWPYWPTYDPYYDPYYSYAYPYYPDANPSSYPAYDGYDQGAASYDGQNQAPAPAPGQQASPDTIRRNLKNLTVEIRKARDYANFQYQDGDISKVERDQMWGHIEEVQKEARFEADANGGVLTADQENALLQALHSGGPVERMTAQPEQTAPAEQAAPVEQTAPMLPNMTPLPGTPRPADEQPRQDLKAVKEKIAHLRTLLDTKVSEGNITRAQSKAESEYLDQLEKLAHAQADGNGGKLSTRQETALLQELAHVDHIIQSNLVVH